jgi:hypothetical protein
MSSPANAILHRRLQFAVALEIVYVPVGSPFDFGVILLAGAGSRGFQ